MSAPAAALTPVYAWDIPETGAATALSDPWPAAEPPPGIRYRWLHLSTADPALRAWAEARLPPAARGPLLQAETRPRADLHDDGLVLNLRGINLNPGQDPDDMVSLRLWVAPRLVITARGRRLMSAEALSAEVAAGSPPRAPDAFLARLAEKLTDRIEEVTLALEDEADDYEEAVFDPDLPLPPALGPARLRAIRVRRYIVPQQSALARLATLETPLLGKEARRRFLESANRTQRGVEELDSVRDRMTALQEHLASLAAHRIGRNGYVLSVVAAIFLPLGFLTGLFGVNLAGMPGAAWPWAFAALALASAVIGVLLYLLFRWLRWL